MYRKTCEFGPLHQIPIEVDLERRALKIRGEKEKKRKKKALNGDGDVLGTADTFKLVHPP